MSDRREAELIREVERSRAELLVRARALQSSAMAILDPRESIRRHPIRGIVLSLATGVILSALGRRREAGPVAGGQPPPQPHPLVSLAESLLPDLINGFLGPLIANLLVPPEPTGSDHPHSA